MIIKQTYNYDNYGNESFGVLEVTNEMPFVEKTTKYNNLRKTIIKFTEVKTMVELTEIINPRMFDSYTDYATFLITSEATIKAEKVKR
ncbi:hypothetical protein AALA52_03635 [Lactococcus ileimucosae]|uniref:Phage protein n=1 Tax=Lactococcus ileimucosae TaxID=2941329 RepID=A0ABV4D1B4_9LACT